MPRPPSTLRSVQPISQRLLAPVLAFLAVEAASGVLLLAATVVALLWANSPQAPSYLALWHEPFTLGIGTWIVHHDLLFVVNEGLMSIFFLLVGLEIRREMHDGALRELRVAGLPLLAALGGVVAPALLYLAVSAPATRGGWAVPTATDIAFAVGVLSLLGTGVPPALRLLLLTLAIADDIVAILIIALFYSGSIHPLGLAIAAGAVLLLTLLQRAGLGGLLTRIGVGVLIWVGLREAGVHPTLAGVILGLLTPVTAAAPAGSLARMTGRVRAWMRLPPRPDQALAVVAPGETPSPCVRMETALHPWVAYLIMPLFALANAGVSLEGLPPAAGPPLRMAAAVVAGLVIGKPLGIVLASLLALRLGLARLPAGVRPRHLVLLGCLGGIGFTMSMFLANLAFTDAGLLRTAKAAVLAGSLVAAVIGLATGRWMGMRQGSG